MSKPKFGLEDLFLEQARKDAEQNARRFIEGLKAREEERYEALEEERLKALYESHFKDEEWRRKRDAPKV